MNWQNTILGRIYHWKKIRSVFNLICTKSKKKYFLRRVRDNEVLNYLVDKPTMKLSTAGMEGRKAFGYQANLWPDQLYF